MSMSCCSLKVGELQTCDKPLFVLYLERSKLKIDVIDLVRPLSPAADYAFYLGLLSILLVILYMPQIYRIISER